jgi:hypothetical protein
MPFLWDCDAKFIELYSVVEEDTDILCALDDCCFLLFSMGTVHAEFIEMGCYAVFLVLRLGGGFHCGNYEEREECWGIWNDERFCVADWHSKTSRETHLGTLVYVEKDVCFSSAQLWIAKK